MGVRTSAYKFEGNTVQPIYDATFQRLTSMPMDELCRQWLGEMFGQLIPSFLIIKTKYLHHCIHHSGVHVLNSKFRILLAGVLNLFLVPNSTVPSLHILIHVTLMLVGAQGLLVFGAGPFIPVIRGCTTC